MKSFSLDFVCVGPQRTGTSWLHQILKHHPQLCLPQDVKETMFFDQHYEQGVSWYAEYFSHCQQDQQCGEVAPTYFDIATVPTRIQQVNPNCKILINLRNPVNRAMSGYHHHLGKGRVRGSFSEAVLQMPRIVEAGRYAQHVSRWLDTFGSKQVTFALLDDIESRPEIVLKQIYQFLDVSEIPMPQVGKEKFGTATMPKFPQLAKIAAQSATWLRNKRLHKFAELGKTLGLKKIYTGGKQLPELSRSEQQKLIEEYEEDIAFIEKLIGRDLSAWRNG